MLSRAARRMEPATSTELTDKCMDIRRGLSTNMAVACQPPPTTTAAMNTVVLPLREGTEIPALQEQTDVSWIVNSRCGLWEFTVLWN